MAILQQCSICRQKQRVANKLCKCGQNLDRAKKSGRVKFWIAYRMPNGKQKTEYTGTSIEEARASEGKRKAQKRETPRVLNTLEGDRMTFAEMTEWYTNLEAIKSLVTYPRILINLRHFNYTFGDTRINDIVQEDLENYQIKRKRKNYADATIDLEVQQAQAMLNKAWENDKISHEVIKPFRTLANLLIEGANARKQHVPLEVYYKLLSKANSLLRPILIIAYNTGMRHGEILNLKWSQVDLKAGFIRLTNADTKEGKAKSVPLNKYAVQALSEIPPEQRLSSEYVFTRNGKTIRDMTDYMRFLCKRAGVPYGRKVQGGITFHDFRRTAKTFMLKAGVDKVYRDKILGHALQGMDKHYMVVEDEDLKRAMEIYTDYLDKKTSELANVDQNVDQK